MTPAYKLPSDPKLDVGGGSGGGGGLAVCSLDVGVRGMQAWMPAKFYGDILVPL